MLKLVPVPPDTPQEKLADHLAIELVRHGIQPGMALPAAIRIMGVFQKVFDGGVNAAIENMLHSWRQSDNWWKENHPDSNTGKAVIEGRRAGQNLYLKLKGD